MNNNLEVLNKYFFGGEAEAEADIRNEVFVSPENINEILSFVRSRYKILLGAKGVGKSLLINVLNESALEDQTISVLLTPGDFDCESIAKKSTNSDKITAAYNQLLKAIGSKIGQYSKGLVVNESEINLNKLSVDEGTSKPDAVSRFASFLSDISPVANKYAQAAQKIQRLNTNTKVLQKDISTVLDKNKKKFWVLLDDVDQASITKENTYDYSVCWAIVAATIQLANDFNQIRSLISIRTDIWHTMTVAKKLGSDRLDKIQDPTYLKFSEEEIGGIFFKRIELANRDLGKNASRSLNCFFKEQNIRLPGVQQITRSWEYWIRKLSRNRPRDMVQLVQQLIEEAGKNESKMIKNENGIKVMLPFAKQRISNIEREYREICPQIKSIIKDISTKTTFDFDEIVKLLKQCPSTRHITIDNKVLNPNDNESGISLLHVLHMANFINARVVKSKETEEYDHILFSMRPDLVSMDNWNELQKYKWEIHPVFHSYVHEIKSQNSYLL